MGKSEREMSRRGKSLHKTTKRKCHSRFPPPLPVVEGGGDEMVYFVEKDAAGNVNQPNFEAIHSAAVILLHMLLPPQGGTRDKKHRPNT